MKWSRYVAGSAVAFFFCTQTVWSATPAAAPMPTPVSVSASATTDPTGDAGRIRIQLVSRDEVDLSSEIAAKIATLPFRDGDAFRAGQTLISLDCSLYAAQLHKAQAEADAARDLMQVDQRLAQLHSVGDLEVQQASGKLEGQHGGSCLYAGNSAPMRDCRAVRRPCLEAQCRAATVCRAW